MTGGRTLCFAIKSLTVGGGAERVFTEIVNGLAARGHAITLLSFDVETGHAFYPLDASVCWFRLGTSNAQKPARLLETLQRMATVRRAVRDLKPAVCVAFMHSSFIPIGLALLGTGTPLIASEHIVPMHYANRPLQRWLLKLTPLLADQITVVSEEARALYPTAIRRRMRVVPNPLTLEATGRADPAGPPVGRKRLLAVGRLSQQKDFLTLVDAFARVAEANADWDLRIVGEGEERATIEARIGALDLGDRIAVPGASRDVGAEYRAAQLFVMPSLYESQGLAAVEAIAHGLPVVVFGNCPGLADVVKEGVNGRLAWGPNRVIALADALSPLMTDAASRVALSAPCSLNFESVSLPRVLDRWEALLESHHATPAETR